VSVRLSLSARRDGSKIKLGRHTPKLNDSTLMSAQDSPRLNGSCAARAFGCRG
jgi:hypothetical protein